MYVQAVTILLAAAIGAAGAWVWQSNAYERQIADIKTEYTKRDFKALEAAHADTQRLQAQAQAAAAAAATRLQRLAADRDRLRAATDGLRDQLATAASRLPSAAPDAAIEYATTLGAIQRECAAHLERLGAAAQGHSDDVRTLMDAWPKTGDK